MNKPNITVVIPIGPNPVYKQWLQEAFDSALNQTYLPKEILIVDDQAHLAHEGVLEYPFVPGDYIVAGCKGRTDLNYGLYRWHNGQLDVDYTIWKAPWLMGCSHAFNVGIALAQNPVVMMHGSDDKLMPDCLESVAEEFQKQEGKDGWYNVTTIGQDGTVTDLPNHAAAVTKGLWRMTGGFPITGSVGAPDALLLSIMLVHMPDRIFQVRKGTPLVWLRQHDQQVTRLDSGLYHEEVIAIRNKETQRWQPPEWTKFT